MYASARARHVELDSIEIRVLEPRIFDEDRNPLEEPRLSIDTPDLLLGMTLDEWAELSRKVQVVLDERLVRQLTT